MSQKSVAFDRLDPRLQRWAWKRRWQELRDVQELAIPPILEGKVDVLLAATTASGKTEAAYLPALTRLAGRPERSGVRILNVSPLKALINDQFRRLEDLATEVDLPVHRWHGDVSESAKRKLRKQPSGILLITPESLEAMFVLRGTTLGTMFEGLELIVVDELHAFLGTERGRQLQSLLHRVECVIRRRVPRIGLSATLGDMRLAAEALRPGEADQVFVAQGASGGTEIRLQIRGYCSAAKEAGASQGPELEDSTVRDATGGTEVSVARSIARHLLQVTRTGHHLVFAGSRAAVEEYTDRMTRESERSGSPAQYLPHHGSLSKEIREATEAALQEESRSATAIATSTLELGIDIGAIETVAQIGPAPTVGSLRQRLGRSGRRGTPSVLRIYVPEAPIDKKTELPRRLRLALFESIAQIELLLEGWCEPPASGALHLSTLVQQIVSAIAQHGGATAAELFRVLCANGPFRTVDTELFAQVLRALGRSEWLMQDATGLLLPGRVGEARLEHYDFYSAFLSSQEYGVVDRDRLLGTIPVTPLVVEGVLLLFAGKRWKVLRVDHEARRIDVQPAGGGRAPSFLGGAPALTSSVVRQRMLALYRSDTIPDYLDEGAEALALEARTHFGHAGLAHRSLVEVGSTVFGFPWEGDRAAVTLALALRARGLESGVEEQGAALRFEGAGVESIRTTLAELLAEPPSPAALSGAAEPGAFEKFHEALSSDLIARDWESSQLDLPGAARCARRLLGQIEPAGT